MTQVSDLKPTRITVDGVDIDVVRHGQGRPLLWLHGVDGINPAAPWFQALSKQFEVIAPWHPGFGHSQWPKEFRHVSDLAYFHMTLVEELGLQDAVLVGSSFGGWLAAEMAVRSTAHFSQLVLIDAYGIKVGGREDRDIADLYSISQEEISRLALHDPAKRARDYSTLADDDLVAIARSREAFTYFGWKPYMHNPGLARWLRRIHIPTLVLWGESDGIVKPDYGRAYAKHIPGAEFHLVSQAGHYPHIEQPKPTIDRIVSFVTTSRAQSDQASLALAS
jgi:pimeloyl-ACP methyl ester carboxylesterase